MLYYQRVLGWFVSFIHSHIQGCVTVSQAERNCEWKEFTKFCCLEARRFSVKSGDKVASSESTGL